MGRKMILEVANSAITLTTTAKTAITIAMYIFDGADNDVIFLTAGGVYDVADNNKLQLYN